MLSFSDGCRQSESVSLNDSFSKRIDVINLAGYTLCNEDAQLVKELLLDVSGTQLKTIAEKLDLVLQDINSYYRHVKHRAFNFTKIEDIQNGFFNSLNRFDVWLEDRQYGNGEDLDEGFSLWQNTSNNASLILNFLKREINYLYKQECKKQNDGVNKYQLDISFKEKDFDKLYSYFNVLCRNDFLSLQENLESIFSPLNRSQTPSVNLYSYYCSYGYFKKIVSYSKKVTCDIPTAIVTHCVDKVLNQVSEHLATLTRKSFSNLTLRDFFTTLRSDDFNDSCLDDIFGENSNLYQAPYCNFTAPCKLEMIFLYPQSLFRQVQFAHHDLEKMLEPISNLCSMLDSSLVISYKEKKIEGKDQDILSVELDFPSSKSEPNIRKYHCFIDPNAKKNLGDKKAELKLKIEHNNDSAIDLTILQSDILTLPDRSFAAETLQSIFLATNGWGIKGRIEKIKINRDKIELLLNKDFEKEFNIQMAKSDVGKIVFPSIIFYDFKSISLLYEIFSKVVVSSLDLYCDYKKPDFGVERQISAIEKMYQMCVENNPCVLTYYKNPSGKLYTCRIFNKDIPLALASYSPSDDSFRGRVINTKLVGKVRSAIYNLFKLNADAMQNLSTKEKLELITASGILNGRSKNKFYFDEFMQTLLEQDIYITDKIKVEILDMINNYGSLCTSGDILSFLDAVDDLLYYGSNLNVYLHNGSIYLDHTDKLLEF